MKAVVPAAGEGRRLRPLTADRPKGLVEVAGRPLLSYCFDTLVDLSVEAIVVVVGYRGDQIRDHFGDRYRGVPIEYVRQERPLGLADALLTAADHVEGEFVVLLGDNLIEGRLSEALERHRATDAAATLVLTEPPSERLEQYGVPELDDGDVVGLVEKPSDPPSSYAVSGLYVLSEHALEACRRIEPSGGELELTDALDRLARRGRVEAVVLDGWQVDVGRPGDVERAERRLESREP